MEPQSDEDSESKNHKRALPHAITRKEYPNKRMLSHIKKKIFLCLLPYGTLGKKGIKPSNDAVSISYILPCSLLSPHEFTFHLISQPSISQKFLIHMRIILVVFAINLYVIYCVYSYIFFCILIYLSDRKILYFDFSSLPLIL